MLRRVGLLVVLLAVAGAAFLAFAYAMSWRGAGPLEAETAITVPEGASLSAAARVLQEAGALRSADRFLLGARFFGGDEPIKAGEYLVPEHASPAELLAILQSGRSITYLVTVPEGMPSILVHERLLAIKDLGGEIDVPAEGSVLPDSYGYVRGESRAAVLARMQAAMTRFLEEAWPKRAKDVVVKTPQDAVTLASIVEKETAKPDERTTVAGVYQNRLRQGIWLQADPTTIYPITKGKPLGRRIRQSELRARNDYNTYAMAGLPKGPIANPGRAAIEAVLNPAKTKALFFVADGEGGHIFADSYAEHQANVQKWYAIRRERGEM